ncbi:MAG: efflux RND transporter periplasmic adaptor subunit [Candidatus Latescibacteria bacterium]|nr:efflux RND transporter periplasmic adaptor subunit [Candidatus Latescibacterota bacterium]
MKPILACLAALALLAGCGQSEAPKQEPPKSAAAQPAGEKCAAHDAPTAWCFICDPALREPGRLWCQEHSRYEDRCWICHPELQDKARLYCNEHGLYEDECFLCHPELKDQAKSKEQVDAGSAELLCQEHGVAEAECGICHPELAAGLKPGGAVKVRLPSAGSADLIGIETAPAGAGQVAEAVECYAEMAFNQNRIAQLSAPVSGVVREVRADLGDVAAGGQVVARIWSAALAEVVSQAVLAHQTLERERQLRAEGISPAKDLQEAEAVHRTTCQQARALGFSEAEIEVLADHPDEQVLLGLRAPFAGEVVERQAVPGAFVEAGQPLFTLTDRSTMWAMLSIPETHLDQVRVGQTVELQVDALPGQTFAGRLTWIAAEIDGRTRLARARAEVPNPEGQLKARMFARARILVRQPQQGLTVPLQAISEVEGQSLVFIKLEEDLYEARAVRLGAAHEGQREVLEGLEASDQVVVRHGFSIKSQLLASRLGAGCADD